MWERARDSFAREINVSDCQPSGVGNGMEHWTWTPPHCLFSQRHSRRRRRRIRVSWVLGLPDWSFLCESLPLWVDVPCLAHSESWWPLKVKYVNSLPCLMGTFTWVFENRTCEVTLGSHISPVVSWPQPPCGTVSSWFSQQLPFSPSLQPALPSLHLHWSWCLF